MIVDSEGGMGMDQNLVEGYWEALASQGRNSKMAPSMEELDADPAEMDEDDLALLADPSTSSAASLPSTANGGITAQAAGLLNPSSSGANLDQIGAGSISANATMSALDKRKTDVAWLKMRTIKTAPESGNLHKQAAIANQ